MEIVLVRHAIAAERDPAKWPDDGDRPLTKQGEERMRKAASGLARIVPDVDLVFSSPLARAWRTAEILHEEVDWPKPEPWSELEPDRSPAQTVLSLAPHVEADRVALVGHEPNLSEVVSYLLAGDDGRGVDIELKKAGAASLGVDGVPGPGTAWLRWLVSPRILRQMAG
jgi:phosphohistidine phosphatase